LPEKVVSSTEKRAKATSKNLGLVRTDSNPDDDSTSQIIKDNAFAFFIRQGGKEEDWGENAERGVREEMRRRWRESEWGAIWGKRLGRGKKQKENKRWVGGSFEVGVFLGFNILEEERTASLGSRRSMKSSVSSPPITPHSTSAGQTFVTAQSEPAPRGSIGNGHSSASQFAESSSTLGLLQPRNTPNGISPPRAARSEVIRRPLFRKLSPGPKSERDVTSKKQGKQRQVHYADEAAPLAAPVTPGPVPPNEVLQRTGDDMDITSAGAAAEASSQVADKKPGDIFMRGTVGSK
jgi:hypothetical protein